MTFGSATVFQDTTRHAGSVVDVRLLPRCYDCHSDETHWPWYFRVAPISWLVAYDVRHERADLDFTRWSVSPVREPTPEQRFRWMCREVRSDIIPPRAYLLAHPHARLRASEKNAPCAWTDQQLGVKHASHRHGVSADRVDSLVPDPLVQ